MLAFERFELNNGLKVLLHKDPDTEIAAVNILYDVGARDEHPKKTGFAHLFEHLMFGGSQNIPKYDEPLEKVGGENNAFTSNDITNYYLSLPRHNIETAFWLESDRMAALDFSERKLAIQKSVVIEEFKESYLNQPYGDTWAILRKMAYKVHPYQWQTIGKSIKHIKNAQLQDVKDFFYKFYRPDNAILSVAGNLEPHTMMPMIEKWFGDIPAGKKHIRDLPQETAQRKHRRKTVLRDIPFNKIFKAYHSCKRTDKAYYAIDLMSDILSNGKSSRLYNNLVKKKKLFASIDAYITGSLDNNLFVFEGTINNGIDVKDAEKAIEIEIADLCHKKVKEKELLKVKNKVEATLALSLLNVTHKAMLLAINELIDGNTKTLKDIEYYKMVTPDDILNQAQTIFNTNNCSTLHYLKKK